MADRFLAARLRRISLARAGRTILRDIDWSIRPGERWVLAGGNGAGKTQLLKLLAGSVWPTPTGREQRSYRWQGTLWHTPAPVREEIAYVGAERQDKYERYGWNHTVGQIVGTGLHRTDIPLAPLQVRERSRVAAVLERLRIGHLAQRRFLTLSYGERRLTLLARALACQPKLLLLDELLNGLDERNRAHALRWLQSTRRSRLPWVLATHRLEDVPACVTHALVLEGGRAVYRGTLARAPLGRWLEGTGGRRAGAQARRSTVAAAPPTGTVARADVLVRLARATVYLDERPVLRNISLEVRAGECWVVHGANGSGKSTLLRTIYGDHAVAAGGRIERAGIEPGVPVESFKRRVGLIAPHLQTGHPQYLTVSEVVQSGRYASIGLNDRPSAADRAAARRALAFFGLEGFGARTLRELSYGQLRRVLFARAWINRPELLLLDEPFAGIDAPARRQLLAHVERLVQAGTSLVMATHHREEWPLHVTHEMELREGRSAYHGRVR